MENEWQLMTGIAARSDRWGIFGGTNSKFEIKLGDKTYKTPHYHSTLITEGLIKEDIENLEKYEWKTKREYQDSDLGMLKVRFHHKTYDYKDRNMYDPKECFVRVDPKHFERVNFVLENLKVGDFVRCKGSSKNRYPWRKVIEIGERSIFSRLASKPNDDHLVLGGTDNAITTIIELIRDDKKLL